MEHDLDGDDGVGDVPPWLDIDDLEPPTGGRRNGGSRRWLVLAGVPWLVAGVVLWRGAAAGDGVPAPVAAVASPGTPATSTLVPTPTPTSRPSVAPPRGDDAIATLVTSAAMTAVGQDEARAVAVVAARDWFTTVGPGVRTADDEEPADGGGRYAEHLVVEGIDHPAPGAAVVAVRAVVLTVAGEGYDAVEVHRLAVPLRFDAAGVAVAGEPYLLPPPAPSDPVELPGLEPIEVPEELLEAGEALARAGYADIAVHALHGSDGWPYLVTAEARVTPEAPRRRVTVWLREHLGRFVVAGTRPAPDRPDADATRSTDPAPSTAPTDPHAEETP